MSIEINPNRKRRPTLYITQGLTLGARRVRS